jgi:hypothetical protein
MTDYVLVAADSSPPGTYTGYQQSFSGSLDPLTYGGADVWRLEHDYGTDVLYFQVGGEFSQDDFETLIIQDSEQGELIFNSVDATYSPNVGETVWQWPNPSPGDPIFADAQTYSVSIGSTPTPTPTPDVPDAVVSEAEAIALFDSSFDVLATVISQYSNSPTLVQLVTNMGQYIDPRANFQAFFDAWWNIDTAFGAGLDNWGRIVGISRALRIPNNSKVFGFHNADVPPDWAPFNQGTFNTGANATQTYLLPDDTYRTLILTKALSNIVATSAASLNQLLRNLFPPTLEHPERGRSYVIDLGGMAMQFVLEFEITAAEYAILTESGALPHPAGVGYSVIVVPGGIFGFAEAGPLAEPFDVGVFYAPPSA